MQSMENQQYDRNKREGLSTGVRTKSMRKMKRMREMKRMMSMRKMKRMREMKRMMVRRRRRKRRRRKRSRTRRRTWEKEVPVLLRICAGSALPDHAMRALFMVTQDIKFVALNVLQG